MLKSIQEFFKIVKSFKEFVKRYESEKTAGFESVDASLGALKQELLSLGENQNQDLNKKISELSEKVEAIIKDQRIIRETIQGESILRVFRDESTGEDVRQVIQESRRLPEVKFNK